jgi:hypothetical protein
MNSCIKKGLLFSLLITAHGCSWPNSSTLSKTAPTSSSTSKDICDEKSQGPLATKNVKPVSFVNETASTSGQLRSGEILGYSFQGEAGKTLSFKTKEDVCISVYSPTNEVIKDLKLAKTGQYTIQVATKQGNQTFNLELSLGDPSSKPKVEIEAEKPVITRSPTQSTQPTQTFAKSDFPKAACGDAKPSNSSAYPVTFYPVNLPDTEANLKRSQAQFCGDSYRKKSKDTGEKFIQVASFIGKENAQAFADLVSSEIKGAAVGSPTTVTQP